MAVEIVPAALAVRAMRDNGYKNAAYALAELMDNAIQAQAKSVELLCIERQEDVNGQMRYRIDQIAVLDNGTGMDEETLQIALQFGNGTNLTEERQDGMGKFGMGLPASSISQACKVEVWTWQQRPESALYSYLDLDEIRQGEQVSVPDPIAKSIPKKWSRYSDEFGESGTLVVWSRIDRCLWKTGRAIVDNSEMLIGRMYRKFLHSGRVSIRMAVFDGGISKKAPPTYEKFALPNDPMYLMIPSSTPAPYNEEAMFERWPSDDAWDVTVPVQKGRRTYNVHLRFSLAKKSARESGTAGSRPPGLHAAKNMGVSIVRAGRELDLDSSWALHGDPRERWWGVEVEFTPALDELFGVSNNKQQARNFTEMSKLDWDILTQNGRLTPVQARARMEEEGDLRGPLVEIAHLIETNLRQMRTIIHAQLKNSRSGDRRTRYGTGAEAEATEKTRERQREGHDGQSDQAEQAPTEARQRDIEASLVAGGLDAGEAQAIAARTLLEHSKYTWVEGPLDGPAFFSVQPRGGAIIITLNTNHPAYSRLVDVLEEDLEGATVEQLKDRLTNALDGVKLLLMAWARYEDEQPGALRVQAQEARTDWGKIARRFLQRD